MMITRIKLEKFPLGHTDRLVERLLGHLNSPQTAEREGACANLGEGKTAVKAGPGIFGPGLGQGVPTLTGWAAN